VRGGTRCGVMTARLRRSAGTVACEYLVRDPQWLLREKPASFAAFLAGPEATFASTTSFLLTYGFAIALVTAFALYRRFRDAQSRIVELERAWTAARLSALRTQLSPH
jgi:hypothetical protein